MGVGEKESVKPELTLWTLDSAQFERNKTHINRMKELCESTEITMKTHLQGVYNALSEKQIDSKFFEAV